MVPAKIMHPRILQLKLFGTYHFVCAKICTITLISDPIIFSSKHHHLSPASSVIAGTTVILGGVAVAMLGSRCNAVTVMVLNLAATPLELRYTQSLSCRLIPYKISAYINLAL